MSFLLCGQTDAGKSTIAGHLLCKVGLFEEPRDSGRSKWSSLLDIYEDEKEFGKTKTHEYSDYDFNYNDRNYTLIDTPGHLIYIREMISALFSKPIDLIVLVISSLEEEFNTSFIKGTVKEDLLLARSVGCDKLLICWNKCDLNKCSVEMKESLENWCKKLRYKRIDHLDVSGYHGDNILNILDYVDERKVVDVSLDEFVEDKLKLNCALYLPGGVVLSSGFICIMHHINGEYEIEVKNITSKKKIIIGSGEVCEMVVKTDRKLKFSKGDKIILRKDKNTIGYGKII